jgi:pimeloyl-ACP methyl ester carboxylesterase
VAASNPRCELVSFLATDGLRLPALLYEPRRPAGTAAIYLHGNGDSSVFYSLRTNAVARSLTERGIAWLPFNNRGAHMVKRFTRVRDGEEESITVGMAHELIAECVHDIDGAAAFLRRRGYRRIFLIGHSTGANKICVYNAARPRNRFAGFILLAGGDDTGLYYDSLGGRGFQRVLKRARAAIAAGRGRELVPPSVTPFVISWASLFDTMNPDGDYNVFPFLEVLRGLKLSTAPLFRHLQTVRKPALVVYGSEDEFCFGDVPGCVAVFQDAVRGRENFELRMIEGANHGFDGRYAELGSMMAGWMQNLEKRRRQTP